MVRPSRPDLEVVGVFNPGVIRHEGEILLLLRVAEAPPASVGEVAAPVYDVDSGRLEIRKWSRDAAGVDATDPRVVVVDGRTWLTSISHLRIARSKDGIRFEVEHAIAMSPATAYESFGIEDPRITLLDDTYWINYTAVSPYGVSTALASTRDFKTFERHGIIFPPSNKDVTIFPEKIGGRYASLHRPLLDGFERPAIWTASSPDLISWGSHRFVAAARDDSWDDAKIGGGAVPFRVRAGNHDGWLAVYHGVTGSPPAYSLGALLLDAADPARVIARSHEPILKPEAAYERDGFFSGVVFTCGLLAEEDLVRIYYGAADGVTAVADLSLDEILAGLSEP
ncbi:MAG: glycoside hydrolase family 130 protein [Vicinamibacterales bacterium]|nr:glycoside hydrolase family 130 protein [Vicinamibacterales bacterium]